MAKSLIERIFKTVTDNLLLFLVLFIGVLFLGVYSASKMSLPTEPMVTRNELQEYGKEIEEDMVEKNSPYQASKPLGTNEEYAKVEGITTSTAGLAKSCASVSTVDPSDLLPKDNSTEWAELNPSGEGEMGNVNLLKAGYHNGINTISGGAMRNANLQLRSDPPIPKENVGPFLQSTIQPDKSRLTMEIGCGPFCAN